MSTNDIPGLLLAGDGIASWWASRPCALLPVTFAPIAGCTLTVDVAEPGEVLSWTAPETDVGNIARLLGNELPVQGGTAPWAQVIQARHHHLSEPWSRLAVVSAVDRWMPLPVSEATIRIDEALALHDTGDHDGAIAILAEYTATLESLTDQLLDELLPRTARPDILRALRIASAAGLASVADLATLAARVEAMNGKRPTAVAWEELLVAHPVAVHASGDDIPDSLTGSAVDPHAVVARVVEWRGAAHQELVVGFLADTATCEVTVPLADRCDADDLEARELHIRAVDGHTGKLIASGAPMPTADGRAVSCSLFIDRHDPNAVDIDVYSADRRRLLAVGPRQRDLVRVDRYALETWTMHRLLTATSVAGEHGEDAEQRIELLTQARTAATAAAAILDEHSTGADSDTDDGMAGVRQATRQATSRDLTSRAAAIRQFRHRLQPPAGSAAGEAGRPLLAELEHAAGLS